MNVLSTEVHSPTRPSSRRQRQQVTQERQRKRHDTTQDLLYQQTTPRLFYQTKPITPETASLR